MTGEARETESADRVAGPGPRIFGIPASDAPVVAVLRRGPSEWWQLGRWLLDRPEYEPGSWFNGALYPQKCDLSPDGRWFAYSALREPSTWNAGSIYEAISRLPYLTALAAWEAGTTYSRGIHFDDVPGTCDLGTPDVGDVEPCLGRYGISLNRPEQFAVERRRGWTETRETPPRRAGGPWDEDRAVAMAKHQPGSPDGPTLRVAGSFAGFRSNPDWHEPAVYYLESSTDQEVLDDVQWADWTSGGRLLVATTAGVLETRTVVGTTHVTTWSCDLSPLKPDPQPAPSWASTW